MEASGAPGEVVAGGGGEGRGRHEPLSVGRGRWRDGGRRRMRRKKVGGRVGGSFAGVGVFWEWEVGVIIIRISVSRIRS